MSAKTGLPAGNGAQDLPEALSPPVSQLCSTPETHMTLGPLPGPALLGMKTQARASLLPLFSPSLSPYWIWTLLWFYPLYHLICFLIWSWAAMWLIKGRCKRPSSQRSRCLQANMLIRCLFACSYLPLLPPTISQYINSFPHVPSLYLHFLSPFFLLLSYPPFSLKISFFSSS